VRYSRARAPNPTDLESTRVSINGISISAAFGVSTEGMPAGTDANVGGAIGDASKLGISAPAAESVTVEGGPGTGRGWCCRSSNWDVKWLSRCWVSLCVGII
jgi:hypothetical protein